MDFLAGGQDHRVDDVDYAVAGEDIGDDNFSVIHHGLVHIQGEVYGFTLQGGGRFQAQDIAGQEAAVNHVVQQDVGQGGDVSQEGFHGSGGQCGKGVIRGGKDRQRSIALEGVNQAGSLDGGDEGCEAAISERGFNDVQRRRQDHRVDHVDHAVGGPDVGDDHFSAVDHDFAIGHIDQDRLALDGVSGA